MAEVTLDQVPQKVRDFFNKGLGAFERGRLDYAIDMLSTCLDIEPRLLSARKFLRAAEIQRYKQEKTGAIARQVSRIRSLHGLPQIMVALKRGKAIEAMKGVDKLLRDNPLERRYMVTFAEAAEKAGIPEAAVQMLEIAREHYPDDADVLQSLGVAYQEAGDTQKAVECFEKLNALSPNDPRSIKALKDALARHSLARDGWERVAGEGEEEGYLGLLKDTDEAKLLEQEAKAVKSEEDVLNLIEDSKSKIEKEPGNVNYRRALARLYVLAKNFDLAVATLQAAIEIAPGDPELDSFMTDVKVARFDAEVATLRSQGKESEASEKEGERDQFVFDSLQDRVARYPNDMSLRYRFGLMLFENDYTNEAIQQFQLAQRTPKHRPSALYYLGQCFRRKEQYDLATQQFEAALTELPRMDGLKKDVLYAMGEVAELTGDRAKAAELFKQIYQVDIQYRDIAEKVEKGYSKGA